MQGELMRGVDVSVDAGIVVGVGVGVSMSVLVNMCVFACPHWSLHPTAGQARSLAHNLHTLLWCAHHAYAMSASTLLSVAGSPGSCQCACL